MNWKIIIGFIACIAVFFGSWFFAWPIVESAYAWDLTVFEDYIATPHKLGLFGLGFLLFFGGMMAGIKVVIN